jgi:hypothetical protein
MSAVRVLLILSASCSFLLVACGSTAPANEQYRQQSAGTVYRAADEEAREAPPTIVPQQKIPGE